MKRYRRLKVGEHLKVGDFYTAKMNLQPPASTSGLFSVPSKEHYMFDLEVEALHGCTYYRLKSFIPQRLIRKYRLVKDNEPVQMFDWFKLKISYEDDKAWPAPDKQYNEGWCQIEPGINNHLCDGHPGNRTTFIFARFVDCVPATKGKKK